ncbi:MAG TPA: NUDIX domain-containing protein [Puia sp.]|nr:NUDIX domain-containing protein [Puia sp.]
MPNKSAGILLFRRISKKLEVLLVHPGGPLWKNKDDAAWTIPKGEFEEGEDPLEAAIREFTEETGNRPIGAFASLSPVRQKSGKWVYAWALEGDLQAEHINSNLFEMEWPPRSGRRQSFPEIDRAAWFDLETARQKINPAQVAFLDELEQKMK